MFKGQLLETIKVVNGHIRNGEYHWARMKQAHLICYGSEPKFTWEDIVSLIPNRVEGIYKFRLIYSTNIDFHEMIPYQFFLPEKWKLVEVNHLDYSFKYADRSTINYLRKRYKQEADDLIFIKNGAITDASYANLVFFDGHNWVTPIHPLLAGTQRAKLIAEEKIKPQLITVADLAKFSHFKLINALLEFDFPTRETTSIIA